jgi:hypothetical protein
MDRTVPIDCPACGDSYAIEISDIVDLGSNPELRNRLVRGALNFALCPHCGDRAPIDHPFLVLDPASERTIFFVPDGSQTAAVDAALLRNVLSIFETEDSRAYLQNQVQVGDWDRLVALLAEVTTP